MNVPHTNEMSSSGRTTLLRQPYFTPASKIFRVSAPKRDALSGLASKPQVLHHEQHHEERGDQDARPDDEWQPQTHLAEEPAGQRPQKHRRPKHHSAAREDILGVTLESCVVEGVHQPRIDRTGLERIPESQDERGAEEPPYAPAVLPRRDIDESRQEEGRDAEKERYLAPDGVGNDTGGHLEDDLTG